jgi:hypothetical protein
MNKLAIRLLAFVCACACLARAYGQSSQNPNPEAPGTELAKYVSPGEVKQILAAKSKAAQRRRP